ncbi:MAG: hypothetical protein KJ731_21110 [Alphaproteobacteria bacterium]|nr:hypothetical protein [Alphaproteobacteria bacterium]MBU1280286.1 hypothetical protein [Alphaproteobacteria bacterium]MBU1573025.1 hypothetical protein [Alphaproteobacteria bacterium]MBU1830951.1 hypothetical protein [Alphaproteobacteria bacterium]MBU2079984.1 hypothetical protein [Alphaproteobacteria bacterium]
MKNDPIHSLLNRIDPAASLAERHDILMNEAMETGGTFMTKGDITTIEMHGIRATHCSETGAIRLWLRAAATHFARAEKLGATS